MKMDIYLFRWWAVSRSFRMYESIPVKSKAHDVMSQTWTYRHLPSNGRSFESFSVAYHGQWRGRHCWRLSGRLSTIHNTQVMASNFVFVLSFSPGNAPQCSTSRALPSRWWYSRYTNRRRRGKTDCSWLSLYQFSSSPGPCTEEDPNVGKSGGEGLVRKWAKFVNSAYPDLCELNFVRLLAWIAWLNISILLGTLSLGLFNASKDDIARRFAYVYAFISVAILVSGYMRQFPISYNCLQGIRLHPLPTPYIYDPSSRPGSLWYEFSFNLHPHPRLIIPKIPL